MCDIEDNRDDYGFEQYQPDGDVFTNSFKMAGGISVTTLIIIIVLFIMGIFLLMGLAAGVYSWSEYPHDEISNKLVKSTLAFIFSPFYLIYAFGKLVYFKN
jgi:hypothetical protein|tara:strand:+ start:189 stop:491 length:303 start_codon:yes stop_codon:yes gene_type:complete